MNIEMICNTVCLTIYSAFIVSFKVSLFLMLADV